MASPVDICNMALSRVKQTPITTLSDLGDNNPRVSQCNLMLQPTLNSVAADGDWGCLMKRSLYSPNTATPAFGYNYSFNLPSDYARPYMVVNNNLLPLARTDWHIEGNQILSNYSSIGFIYISQPTATDTSMLRQWLADAASALLAYRIAPILSGDTVDVGTLLNEYKKVWLSDARSQNRRENPWKTMVSSGWIDARYAGFTLDMWPQIT